MRDPHKAPSAQKLKMNAGEITGLVIMGIAGGIPLIMWIALSAQSCVECAFGWQTVIATWLAAPFFMLGGAVWLTSLIVRLVSRSQK